jgi:hypothetical protein
MLKQFNSNARKLNRIISKINLNNLVSFDLTGSLLNIEVPSTTTFESNSRKLIRTIPIVNNNITISSDLTGSLSNIEVVDDIKFNSTTRQNSTPTKVINNVVKISDFHKEILEYSARDVQRNIDTFDAVANTLTILNTKLDYGTVGASASNFEILIYGLRIPVDYSVTEVGNDVVITLNDYYIDYDIVTIDDIYVIGKFL